MKIKSFSKINLTLRVLKKLKNGMHQVETNSSLINIFDEIKIIKAKKDEVIFEGEFKKKISSKKNTIVDTLQILRKLGILKYFYKIIVKKNIPVFAGLGGGTSNSAFLVKHFVKNKINEKLINIFEKKIGSDFRLFFSKKVRKGIKNKK
jgi:4-diphosphocytidyl-2-C-methyl-D-erythritol kinase